MKRAAILQLLIVSAILAPWAISQDDAKTQPAEQKARKPAPIRVPDFREVYKDTPVTRAVDRGLAYLRSKQLDDGSWLSPGYGKNTGMVSLAVMAFLARGHEPGRGEYGATIDRAVAWVIDQQRGGLILRDASHGELYSHGISTLMIGEVVGMVDDDRPELVKIHRVHRSAVNLILRAQNVPKDRWNIGGWRYTPSSEVSDISVTGWQLLALRAAKDVGLPVPDKNIRRAVGYVARCAHPSGGFSYQPGSDPNHGRTGTGVLALEICGAQGSPEAKRGGDWLLRHPPKFTGPFFYYGAYYASQAMYQLGDHNWKTWQPLNESLLLDKQNDDGSWPTPPNATHEEQAGPVYATALAILSLSVEFRYLPIYQR